MNLAERLKRETRSQHVEVERTPFIAALLRGRLDRRGYLLLLRNLKAIYAALEPALHRHAAHPALARFDFAALARTDALASDIEALRDDLEGDDDSPPLGQPTVAHADHLATLDQAASERLLAHAYVRYLGDLSGGQVLGRIVRESFRLLERGDGVLRLRRDTDRCSARCPVPFGSRGCPGDRSRRCRGRGRGGVRASSRAVRRIGWARRPADRVATRCPDSGSPVRRAADF